MKLTERKKMILINIVCVLALAVILWPLLVISKYNYPSADDWSYGVNTYRAIQNHEGVFQFLKTVYETVTGIAATRNLWRTLLRHCRLSDDWVYYFLRDISGGAMSGEK